MNPEIIAPDIFQGLPVKGFFTTKSFSAEGGRIIAQLHAEAAYLPIQKHTGEVIVADYDLEPKVADAVVTSRHGLVIGIQVADCVPVLLYDKRKHIAGAVHAGWRGTAEGILPKTIGVFRERFYSSPSDIIVAVGPSIKECCYVVGPEVVDAVTKASGKGEYVFLQGETRFIDLPGANRLQALRAGILPQNIWTSQDCTHCLPGRYYSYRYMKGTTGRQYGFIALQ